MHRLRAVAFASFLALGVLAVSQGAEANHPTATCSVTPTTVAQGGRINVRGSTLTADETFTIRLGTTSLGDETTDDNAGEEGHFDENPRVPSGTAVSPPTHTVTIDRAAPAADIPCGSITVTAPTPTPTASPTPTATATATPRPSGTDEPDRSRAPSTRRGTARLNVLGDDKFQRGERVRVTAARVSPNEAYALDFAQSPGVIVARATTNRLGSARFEFRIPSDARTGAATLTALPADGSGRTASARIEIIGGSAAGGGGGGKSLPATGKNVAVYTALGLMLLLGGLSMQRYEWQRKARPSPVSSKAPKRLWD